MSASTFWNYKVDESRRRKIVVFTDCESDDVAFLRGLRKLHPNSQITLVVGESAQIHTKVGIARAMGFFDVIPGLPSDKQFPEMEVFQAYLSKDDDFTYSQERVLAAIRQADVVVGIKPMRELVGCTEQFTAEFYMSGSFNLRCLLPDQKIAASLPFNDLTNMRAGEPHPAKGLRHNFPGETFFWVETFMAVGEANSVTTIGQTSDAVFNLVRMEWNNFLCRNALKSIQEMGDLTLDITPKKVASIFRKAKIANNITECPNQFILADFLVLMAMQGEFVKDAFFTGANPAGYSQFFPVDDNNGAFPVQIMDGGKTTLVLELALALLESLFKD